MQQTSNTDVPVQEIYEDPRATWAAIQQLFVRMATGRALGEIRAPGPTCIRLAPSADETGEYVEFEMEFDPEKFSPASRGTMFMSAAYRSAAAPRRRLHIVPLLPAQFGNYLRFASRAEFVLCFTAWLHVATQATRALLAAQWRLTDES